MGKPQSNFQYCTIFGVPLIAGNLFILLRKRKILTMKILTDQNLITLGRSLFKVEERKINSCTGCDGGDHCKEVYARFHEGTKMGCHRLIFKLIEKK